MAISVNENPCKAGSPEFGAPFSELWATLGLGGPLFWAAWLSRRYHLKVSLRQYDSVAALRILGPYVVIIKTASNLTHKPFQDEASLGPPTPVGPIDALR